MASQGAKATPDNVGVGAEGRKQATNDTSGLLLVSYSFWLMTHDFRRRVTGPMFNTLHAMRTEPYALQRTALTA